MLSLFLVRSIPSFIISPPHFFSSHFNLLTVQNHLIFLTSVIRSLTIVSLSLPCPTCELIFGIIRSFALLTTNSPPWRLSRPALPLEYVSYQHHCNHPLIITLPFFEISSVSLIHRFLVTRYFNYRGRISKMPRSMPFPSIPKI